MTREEVVTRLRDSRAAFDAKVALVPASERGLAPPGFAHSPKDVVAHVIAYEELIVERLRAARRGETTAFDRDRDGWESFNARVWADAERTSAEHVMARSELVFNDLLTEIEPLDDAELTSVTGITVYIDPAWLEGRSLAELIAIDAYEHYPLHFAILEAAARAAQP